MAEKWPGDNLTVCAVPGNNIDECTTGIDPCSATELCTNTDGGYSCLCRVGYERIGIDCIDINECYTDPCGTNEECDNSVGGYTCTCKIGYTYVGTQCNDVNECDTNNGGCTEKCINTDGSYHCEYCSSGYRWNSVTQTCDNIDECTEETDICQQECIDGAGDYSCSCFTGYRTILAEPDKCEDVNECNENTDICEHYCTNTDGSYTCQCMTGYTLEVAGVCSDINECSLETDECDQGCTNTIGSYDCSCTTDYYQPTDITCEPIGFSVNAKASVTSSSAINLEWKTTYTPTGYIVSLSYKEYYRDITFSTPAFIEYGETDQLQQDITSLLPNRYYELYVSAIGSLTSEDSNIVTVKTDEDIPSMAPTIDTVTADSATQISISWSTPSIESQNGIIDNYVILIDSTELTASASSTFYTITGLNPYTEYTLQIAAATSVGTGPYSTSSTITTLESTPTSSPLLSVTTITETTITLTLSPPTDIDTLNGVITFYTVTYTGVNVDTTTQTVRVTPITTDYLSAVDYIVNGLQEGVSYEIQASVSTSVGSGPNTDVITVTTNEIAPTGTPQNIEFTIIMTTSLSLSWDSPPLSEQNGVITGYKISYNGVTIDTEVKSVIVTTTSTTLTDLEEGSEYLIEISAINSAGVGSSTSIIKTTAEIAPTGTPLNVVVRSDSSTSISVKWSSLNAEAENGVIKGYQIEVIGREHDSNIYTKNVSENSREYTLSGLEEGHSYEVTIRAYNEIGYGPRTSPIILSTLESVPGSAPQNLADKFGKTWIYLKWIAPAIVDHNGDITNYEIAYEDLGSTSNSHTLVNTTDLNFNFTNLEEYEFYLFRIRAYTAIGPGPYSAQLAIRTLQDVPSASPINIQSNVLSATDISFEWESPPLIDQNGVLTGFGLKIHSEDNTYQRDYLLAASRNSYTFSNLHPYTNYTIQVRAETSPGAGPYTVPLTLETYQAAPSGTPNNVEFVIFTTSISIRWQDVDETEQNGIITGYIVKYRGIGLDTETRNLSTTYRHATLNNLKEGNQYQISISATTYVGNGPYLTVYNATEAIPPTAPPSDFTVLPSGSTSLLISWNPPSLNTQNGAIIGYLIVVVGLQHDSSVYHIDTNSTLRAYTLSSLEEGHLYYVSMSATNSAGYGPYTQNISVITNDAAPSSAPQHVNAIASTTSLFIIWSTPPIPDHNGVITKYEVKYIDILSGANNSLFETELRIIIPNLHENELFEIQVRAYTSFGPGPYSTVLYVRTLEAPPSAAPTAVSIVYVSDTEIIVEWLDPPMADLNGVLTEYEIKVDTVHSSYVLSVQGSINAITITNLHPYTDYIIQIRANTQPGSGPYSTPVTVTTEQAPPSGPPQNVQAIASTTYIILSWEAPNINLQNGNISTYSITYSGVTIDINDKTISTPYTSYRLSNLEEGIEYDISICAYTIAFGPCAQIYSTTSEVTPTEAPTNLQVRAITSTSTTISWEPPTLEEQNGVITGYEVIAVGQQHDTNIYEDIVSEYTLSYKFDNLEEFHEYKLQVRARNAIGFGPYTRILTVVTSEDVSGGAPLNLTYKSTETTIKLSWSEPLIHLHNGKLLYYEIEYYVLSNYLTNTHSVLTNVSTSQTYIMIYDLHEDVLYQLKVRAYTSFGPGPYSVEISVRTKQAIPSSTPTNFQLVTLSATQILSTCGPPPVLEQNGQITGYEFSVHSSTNSTLQIYSTTQTSYTFQNLQPNTQYTIQIRAINSIGPGPYTGYISATTQQSLPSGPPTDLKLTVITAYQIIAKWLPPPVLEQNGQITGYDVRLVSTINSFQEIYSTNQTQITIESLHPDTSYSIQVRAKNSIGPSPYTALITNITLAALPSSPPTDFTVSVLSATEIQLEYNYPLAIDQNGAITAFDISVSSNTDSLPQIFSTDLTSYTIQSLHPFTSYSIQIRAINSIGAGPYTQVTIVITNQALPVDAPTQLTLSLVTHNSVNFSWNPIPSSSLNGEFVSYIVLVTDTQSTTSFSHTSISPNTIILNLTPYTNYSLSVAVINTQGTGPYSSDLTLSTHQSSPSQGPEIFSIDDITDNSAVVQFSPIPLDLQNGPIISYALSLYISTDSVPVTSVTLNTLSYTLTNLLPYRKYTVEITATNSAGTSPPSSMIFMTIESVPTGPPTSISATPYSTYVTLQYQPPVYSEQNGIIISYSIKFGNSTSTTTYTTDLTEYTINDLEELTQFGYSIAASTSIGIGPYSTKLYVTTLSAPPSVAPQNVTAIPQSYQSIFVSWNPVPEIHHNGEIISYIVYYQGEQYETSERKQVESGSSTSATLEHLKPYESYQITVAAENNQGSGPNSDPPTIARTFEGYPSVAPTGITAISITATSIRTKWTAIPPDETNGILTQYEIIYQSDSTFDSSQYKFTTPGNVTEAVLEDLHPAVEYQLFVRGYTSVGNGPNSPRVNVLLPESNPSGAPVITAITVASQTEIYIVWLGIIVSERNGIITAYEVKYSSKSPQTSDVYSTLYQNITGEILNTHLANLEVGTEYEIGVRGYTAVGSGPYSTFLAGTTAPALINCYEFFNTYFYNPCYNNGVCLPDDSKAYRCQCAAGYTGLNCLTDIDDCEENQCDRGECIDEVNGYLCVCGRGYTGEYCDYNIDDCGDNACLNGAVCVDGIEEYTCNCTDNYSGTFCQFFNTCVANPCLHGSCLWENYSYTCTCEPGYEGENCSINIDDCRKNSCKYGECFDQLESYECNCYVGFKGIYCEIPSNGDTCKQQELAGFYWEETGYGNSRKIPCGLAIKGLTGNATRYCKPDGDWADLDISDCARPTFRDLDYHFNHYVKVTGYLDPIISIDLVDRLSQEICTNQTEIIESIEPTFYPYEISVITGVLTQLMISIEAQDNSTQAMMISQMTPSLLCIISRIVNIGNLQIFTFTNSSLKAIDINEVIEKIAKLNAMHFNFTNSDPTLFSEENIHLYITPLTNGQSVTLPEYELSAVKDTGLYPDNVLIPHSEVSDLFSKSNGEVPVIAVVFSRYLGQAMGAHSQSTTLGFSPIGTRVITIQTSLGQPLNFTSPITLEYWVFDPYNTSQVASCVAWDGVKWSDEGLYLSERSKHTISCYSTHTTSFAILFSLQPEPRVPEEQHLILRIAIYTLGIISFISLVTGVILLLILGKDLLRSDQLICHINLAISLILALIFCIIGLHPITSIPITCKLFTIAFQYSTLASVCWIFCIAVQSIYMLFARNRLIRTFFIFIPIGWVTPLIITAATSGINWINYGVLDSYCWTSKDSTTFWMIVGPILAIAVIDVVMSFFLVCRISTSKLKEEWHNQAKRAMFGLVILSILLSAPWILIIVNMYIQFIFFKWIFTITYITQGVVFLLSIVLPIKLIRSKVFRIKKNTPDTSNQDPQLGNDTRRPSQHRLLSVSEDFTYQLSPPGANSDYFNPLYNAINLDPEDIDKLNHKESFHCAKEPTKIPLVSPYQSMKISGAHHDPAGYDNPYMEINEDSTANPFLGIEASNLQVSAETHVNPFSANVDKDESNIYSEPRFDGHNQPIAKQENANANDVNVECTEDMINPENDTGVSPQDDMPQFVDEGFAHENPTYSALPRAQLLKADTGFENPSYMAVGKLNLTEGTDNADNSDV
ncbi:Phosphatidylinositol phosphatase PTPRQ-like [Oopsacas minuta]|uniref:Phosphatidylinositol phosphatase PTPRQ-like n=1 Tax=Oopsacas minuta TaxID=111878 RepID=A0AAV7KJA2_9METZ|nr:Phosphatidylinositol phosphatase PTPRQ-like [Oopsacas minuta]